MELTSADVALIRAAASLAAHAPEKMRAAHMTPRLEALARRIAAGLPREEPAAQPEPPLLQAA
ncbi:MAG TPA: hypothetical protein VHG28_11185 [Longimicrobiaceae bacterium]|nr:hypothetical protein [Longimicrobiaceae bacterium]